MKLNLKLMWSLVLLGTTQATPISQLGTVNVRISDMYYRCNCPHVARLMDGTIIECSYKTISNDCNLLQSECLCLTDYTAVSLVKRGPGSSSQGCFGSGQTGPGETSELNPAIPVSEFVKSLEKGTPLSDDIVESFDASVARFMEQKGISSERFRQEAQDRFLAHFLPSFEQSKAKLAAGSGYTSFTQLATDSVKQLLADKGLLNEPEGQHLMKEFKVVTIDEFTKDMEAVIGRMKKAGLEENGVLVAGNLGQKSVRWGKSNGWIARHLIIDRGLNPKYLLTMAADGFGVEASALDALHQSIGVEKTLNLFYVDDASYSGQQAGVIVHNAAEYVKGVGKGRKVNIYLEIPYMTEQAKNHFEDALAYNLEDGLGADSEVKLMPLDHAQPIPSMGEEFKGDSILAYYGTMIFEHKVPDSVSFNGPLTDHELIPQIMTGLEPGSAFPPYKRKQALYNPPEPEPEPEPEPQI